MDREFDLIIFGASGFTGQYVLEELCKVRNREGLRQLRFAIAGRNDAKLRSTLQQCSASLGEGMGLSSQIPIVIADTNDDNSLKAMASRTKVLVNCTGPFRFHGEQVVRACIAASTDYLDISGEPQFSESVAIKYHEQAVQAGCLIITTCGFDCIPADMGTVFAAQQFKAPAVASTVEAFISLDCSHPQGPAIHYTTYEALIHSFGNVDELRELRKNNIKSKTPMNGPRLDRHSGLFHESRCGKWCYPFMGADAAVVRASQRMFMERPDMQQDAVQFATYITFPSFWTASKFLFFGGLISLMAKTQFGREQLLKRPEFFSNGLVTHAGPSKDQISKTSFKMTFYSRGFSDGVPSETSKHNPDVAITTEINGPEPGYDTTPICVIAAALSLLQNRASSHVSAGVYTPAVVFCNNKRFMELLEKASVRFSIVGTGSS